MRKQLFILLLALVLPILAACGGNSGASPSASAGGASASASSGTASSSPSASASSSAATGEASPTAFATESAGSASASASTGTGTGGTTETATAEETETTGTGVGGGAGTGATETATAEETETTDTGTGGVGGTATAEETETSDTGVGTGTTATADETTTAGAGGVPGGAGSGEGIRIGLVTDVGKINDGTFNQFAYQGLQRAQQELGVQIEFIETQQPTDYERNLDQFANQDFDLVVGVGFLMGDAINAAAVRHPDVNFAIVDSAPAEGAPTNLKGLIFQEDQAGYLAGAMASLVSQSRVVGVVGGVPDVPAVRKFVEGYAAGANAIATTDNSTISVQQVYIPSFTDAAQGAEAARSQIAEGADVVFGAGGQTGSGAIQAAAQSGAYVIGVDQDEYVTTFRNGSVEGSDRIITSAIKRVDNAVFDTVQSVVNGTFTNELYVGNAANQGIGYAPAHDATDVVTQEVINRLDDILEGLANGTVQTGVEQ